MLNFKPRSAAGSDSEAAQNINPKLKNEAELQADALVRRNQQSDVLAREESLGRGEKSESDYLLYLMEHGQIEPDTPVNFAGLQVPLTVFTEDFPRLCCEIEAEMGLDLKTLAPEQVAVFLKAKMSTQKALTRRSETTEELNRKAEGTIEEQLQINHSAGKDKAYAAWTSQFETTTALIENLDTLPVDEFPELAAEKLKLEPFRKILSLAQNESDQQILAQKVNALPLSKMPDPIQFIQTQVFSSPENPSGVSRETQVAIAEAFNISPERLATGSDLVRVASKTVVDPETGKSRPLYDEKNKLTIRKTPSAAGDVFMHTNEQGEQVLEVTLSDGRHREVKIDRLDADELRTYTNLLGLYAQLEEDGNTDFLGEGVSIEHAIMNIRDPFKRTKLENTLNALLGGSEGFDGKVLDTSDYQQIGFYVNYLGGGKGDAQIGDFSKEDAVERRTGLGIHPVGEPQVIQYDVLRTACSYMREHWVSAKPDYDSLQAHLTMIYPELVKKTDEI